MALKRDEQEKIIADKVDNSGLKKLLVKKEKVLKDDSILIKITKDDRELLRRYAESKGSNISNEIRRLIYELFSKEGLK